MRIGAVKNIPVRWRRAAAQLVKLPLLRYLMVWGIRFVVARHRVGVALVALDEQDRVLLLRHVFHPFTPWGLPGGWLNRHEAPDVGVLRELKEETGLTAVIESILAIEKSPSPSHLGIIYQGRIQSGQMALSAEIIEAGWFTIHDLPGPLAPTSQKAIEAVIGKQTDD
jgi:ADP-ribose pyrophosphatase YjhB (NUDIX family)